MKALQTFSIILSSVLLVPASTPGAEESGKVMLRYSAAVQTNVYSLELDVQGESGRESIAGTLTVISRPAGTNFINVSMRGMLRPKPGAMMPPMGYRPSTAMPLLAYLSNPSSDGRELLLDARGRVIRQAGDVALPVPLGQLMTSLLQSFPAGPSSEWQSEEDVSILDEPLLQGPATAFLNSSSVGGFGYMPSYYPGRPQQGVLAANQKVKVRVAEASPETVTLQKTVALDSLMLTGQEPRVSASSEMQIQLDRTSGLPKKVEAQCKTVAVTETLSRRTMVTLKWELLEGKALEAVLSPPPPPPQASTPATVPAEDLSKLLQRLKSDETGSREVAARELESQNSRLVPTPELLSLMVSLVNSGNDTLRHAGLSVLASHGTKEHVPLLIKTLSESDSGLRGAAAKALGRLQDPRAIEPLVLMVATGQAEQSFRPSRDGTASEALIRIGAPAESAVLDLLKEKNLETRIQACSILKQIGTKKSLAPLKEIIVAPSKELGDAAADACRTIQGRVGSGS